MRQLTLRCTGRRPRAARAVKKSAKKLAGAAKKTAGKAKKKVR